MMVTNLLPQTTALLLNSDQVDLLKGILLGVIPKLGDEARALLAELDDASSRQPYPSFTNADLYTTTAGGYTWSAHANGTLTAIPPEPNRAARRAKSANKTKKRSS